MKILIVNVLYPPHKVGGAEKSVSLLAEALVRAGDEVVVATLDDIAAPAVAVENGVKVHRLPMDNLYWPYDASAPAQPKLRRLQWHARNRWNRTAARRFAAILDAERPDVVHCNVVTGFSAAIWPEITKRGLPLVQTLRDYGVMCTRSALFKNGANCATRCLECRVLTAPAKTASRQVDQLVSNSDYVIRRHHAEGYFPGVPARRIFNIVPLDEQPRDPPAPDAPFVFGFIGRVEAEKGIDVVLEATTRVTRADWRLKIAGVGVPDYVAELKARYPDPRIEWLGFSQAADFYRAIDTVLISSVWPEPLPRTLIEALSYGLSAICAEAGGIPEIADLAAHAITYQPTDVEALAAAMDTALGDAEAWRAGGLRDPDALNWFAEDRIVAENRAAYADAIASVGTRC
ncbi:glycosyltransferase involved in cell wall biosynthesis [Sphingomonas sp. BE138]|uniref:glycosyltransferase family 4 protein n=1 Tax=Sphingomonas sp. BE138 TaxID=2817845 RepID=UPI00285F96DB|nr:glycosyltransferase family 4 protein [Sphingomonas sp. BE138]MDR6788107.1 glycosyltransferase involved in cell wall biosynthesis [Sphingomonas sp. BE138]